MPLGREGGQHEETGHEENDAGRQAVPKPQDGSQYAAEAGREVRSREGHQVAVFEAAAIDDPGHDGRHGG